MASKVTKTQKLLNAMKRRKSGFTPTEAVSFLLGFRYEPKLDGSGKYNALLYGTRDRAGILERFCKRTAEGKYRVVKAVAPPFTVARKTAETGLSTF